MVPRRDFAALTFLGAGPVYHKEAGLRRMSLKRATPMTGDDVSILVTRGVARTHRRLRAVPDHKFDPISDA